MCTHASGSRRDQHWFSHVLSLLACLVGVSGSGESGAGGSEGSGSGGSGSSGSGDTSAAVLDACDLVVNRNVQVSVFRTFLSRQSSTSMPSRACLIECSVISADSFLLSLCCCSAHNSRKYKTNGVVQMTAALNSNGWSATSTVGATLASRKELLALGIAAADIDAQDKLFAQTKEQQLYNKILTNVHTHALEKTLLDPSSDQYVVVFDGQHRSTIHTIHSRSLALRLRSPTHLTPACMFYSAAD